ncbi:MULTISPECIES: ROK family transcriptional regulator [Providencia]|uniref:ROK family transcriptional regulator n=1 Tax=Providencia TaxID=586 RepID=UPI00300DA131
MSIENLERLELRPTQRLLLDLIRRHAPITRAELSKLSMLTPGAITQQCRELLFLGLIIEGEKNTGQRGQPSLPLRLNPGGGCSIGISFSSGCIDIVFVDLCGKKLLSLSEPHQENTPFSVTLKQIQLVIEQILKKKQLQHARILGIGYSIPGFLKLGGKLRHCVRWLESWREIDLQAAFSKNLPWPTYVENNANAAAIGELYSGFWNAYQDFTYIDLGYGIGAGIIIDGKLLHGSFKNGGEVGMAFPTGHPRPSYKDLLLILENNGFSESQLAQLISDWHPVIENWFQRACTQLEQTIMGCLQWIDPQLIIIGGAMPKAIIDKFVSEISTRLDETLDPNRPKAILMSSVISTESAAWGAAMLPLYQIVHQG